MGTITNSVDSDEMPHYAAFHWGLHYLLRIKRLSDEENAILFKNYNLTR